MVKKKAVKKKPVLKRTVKRKDENPVHIMINSPLKFRKQVLNCALDTAQMLQEYPQLKEKQEKEKSVVLRKLHTTMKQIKINYNKLEKAMPKVQYQEEKKKPVVKEAPKAKEVEHIESPKPVEHKPAEVDKLKQELEDIERKISQL